MCRPANVKALSAFETSNGQKYLSEVLIEKKQHTGDELIQDGSGMIPATLYTCVLSIVD